MPQASESPISDAIPEKDTAVFEAEIAARMAAADTVAIAHERLERVFPEQIAGYAVDVDKASTFATNRFAFSEAIRVFYDEREEYIELIIGDYVADPDFFRANLQRYNEAGGREIDGVIEEKISGANWTPAWASDFFAWRLYNRPRRLARFYVGIDRRYFLTVEASGRDAPLAVEEIRNWVDWGALRKE